MSSSWTRGCPCKDCSFKNKNSYPLVNYIQNCAFERKYLPKERFEMCEMMHFMCSEAKGCLYRGCDFESEDTMEIIHHVSTHSSLDVFDHSLFSQLLRSWDQYQAASKADSKRMGFPDTYAGYAAYERGEKVPWERGKTFQIILKVCNTLHLSNGQICHRNFLIRDLLSIILKFVKFDQFLT